MSQSFFVVSPKIDDFANQFLDTVLQCCPTIFGRFSHPDAHYFCRFLEFGRGGDDFLRKNRIISAAFRRFSISPQPISHWLRGFFAFSDSFQFLFEFSIFYLYINKEAGLSNPTNTICHAESCQQHPQDNHGVTLSHPSFSCQAAQPCHGCCRRYQCGINGFDSWGGSYGHCIQIRPLWRKAGQ